MTASERTGIRELKMSGWVRNNLPDSCFGFLVTDLDFIMYNFNTKKIMLLEIKTRNSQPKKWQRRIFQDLARWIKNGIDSDWEFLGFHLIVFENTFFDDGKCYWDNKLSNEDEIRKILGRI